MASSFTSRYLTATRYTLLEQARNRLALGLLVVFIPIWYYFGELFTTADEPTDFKFRVTGVFLHVSARQLTLLTLGLNALTLIVGFMFFASTRKNTQFDRRLVLSGYPQVVLVLAKLTALVAGAAVVSLYTSAILLIFWRPNALPVVWLGFFGAALIYGALGLLLGVLVKNELAGFFVVIMVSLLDTFIQNPLGNPAANQDIVKAFPSYGPTQVYVAGGFTNLLPGTYLLVALAWFVGFAALGLLIFWWRTRARSIQAAPLATPLAASLESASPQAR
jgi:ABC-2 type transport system permease protein